MSRRLSKKFYESLEIAWQEWYQGRSKNDLGRYMGYTQEVFSEAFRKGWLSGGGK